MLTVYIFPFQAYHVSSPKDQDDVQLYRYYSPQDQYISLQTTTEAPRVRGKKRKKKNKRG